MFYESLCSDSVVWVLVVLVWLSCVGMYSLKSGYVKVEDFIVDFLFGDCIGYCVYFVYVVVYLM